jgi:N-acetylglucosaminyl-diphospho-decaprenol L-rhamnosyltransferase
VERARVSVLIVNWNSRELLRRCLLSIRATCFDLVPQVVVVDSGSFDGCAEMLAAEFPDVEFVQSARNIGFGRSNNLGFAHVTGETLLLLNPDTEVRPGAVQRMLTELDRLPWAGILAPRLLNSDLTLQSSVHALPRPVLQALDSEFLRRLLSRLSLWAPPTDFAPPGPVAVEAVAGACMMLRAATFREVGGFRHEYFMYAEDMDLCLKVRRAGLCIYHIPQAEILHHSGASSSGQGSKFSAVMMREALHTYMRLNHGWASAAVYRVFTGISGIVRLLLMLPGLLLSRGEERRVRGATLSKWRSILSWSVGLERWTQQYSLVKESDPRAQTVRST